jgi:hypothetical protein
MKRGFQQSFYISLRPSHTGFNMPIETVIVLLNALQEPVLLVLLATKLAMTLQTLTISLLQFSF